MFRNCFPRRATVDPLEWKSNVKSVGFYISISGIGNKMLCTISLTAYNFRSVGIQGCRTRTSRVEWLFLEDKVDQHILTDSRKYSFQFMSCQESNARRCLFLNISHQLINGQYFFQPDFKDKVHTYLPFEHHHQDICETSRNQKIGGAKVNIYVWLTHFHHVSKKSHLHQSGPDLIGARVLDNTVRTTKSNNQDKQKSAKHKPNIWSCKPKDGIGAHCMAWLISGKTSKVHNNTIADTISREYLRPLLSDNPSINGRPL